MNSNMQPSVPPKVNWHCLTLEESLAGLKSCPQGLTDAEAKTRLEQYGPNELQAKRKISPWRIFFEQFKDLLIIILLVAVVLSAVMGEVFDALLIVAIVIFAAVLGFVQEYRAEKSMEALKRMAAPLASVLRGNNEVKIPARELVPGDIVVLRDGDRVPADARLIEAVNLQAEEASLTGESVPVEKSISSVPESSPIADRRNMVLAGTSIAYGRGLAVVTNTGMNTEFGKIAGMIQEIEKEKTPLEVNLDRMSKWIAIGSLSLTGILALLRVGQDYFAGILSLNTGLEILLWGVSLAIAAVPEALPAVVTISLAIGVQRMVKRHALVRKLPAVETLGCTTVICSDKTGTLTQNQMTVRKMYTDGHFIEVTGSGYEPQGSFIDTSTKVTLTPGGEPSLKRMLEVAVLCNDSKLNKSEETWSIQGDPTEGALMVLAAKGNIYWHDYQKLMTRLAEIPFTSDRKRMTTINSVDGRNVAFTKGAPEIVLGLCQSIITGGKVRPLTDKDRQEALSAASSMSNDALRTLAMAYKEEASHTALDKTEEHMVFAGLVGMIDPPRPEVRDAIQLCRRASIKPIMVTGDHKATAVAVGRELGLLEKGRAISGEDLDKLSDSELGSMIGEVEVIARVSPAHKMRVVNALATRGEVVAMTGDGVNDAPALRKADIGIAMGITGTDVTKESADMILTDDNFASIVAAVEEGRGLFGNIKKYLVYLLSCNLGELLLMAAAVLMGLPVVPLIAIQILFVNLATDGLPALALSVDPPDPDIMDSAPRRRNEGIFTRSVIFYVAGIGLWTAIVTLGVFLWAYWSGKSPEESQSLCFVTLILVEFFNAFNCRSQKHSVFKVGFFKNRWLLASIALNIVLLLLIVYVPVLQGPFNTYALDPLEWAIAIGAGATILVVVEISKAIGAVISRRDLMQ
jgi:P-type Ca2+ transporter type 2C